MTEPFRRCAEGQFLTGGHPSPPGACEPSAHSQNLETAKSVRDIVSRIVYVAWRIAIPGIL
jgi:hypothetical protein